MAEFENTCPIISVDPADPSFFENPYPTYDRIREMGPLVYWQEYGFPVSARYENVSQLFRDKRLGRDLSHRISTTELGWPEPEAHLRPFYDFEKRSMLENEPPVHTRLRGIVNRAFVSRAIERLRPNIDTLCDRLISGFLDRGRADLLVEYASPIPVNVMAELLGIPLDDVDLLLDWSHRMVAMYQFNRTRDTEDSAVSATLEFSDYIRAIVDRRRRRPADDLISMLIAARDEKGQLTEDELVTTIILLMNAGHEATVHAFGNGLRTLLEIQETHVQKWSKIKSLARTDAGASAVAEEVLRHDTPLHLFTRYVLEDVELFGQHFHIGDKIGLLLAAANRDPTIFDEPNEFAPERFLGQRSTPLPMSFGAGIHFCVGAPLARLELQIGLPKLLLRIPTLRRERTSTFRNSFHFRATTDVWAAWCRDTV